MGYTVLQVSLLKGKAGEPLLRPLYLVHLDPLTDMSKFKLTKFICRCSISICKYTPRTQPAQCFRCQQFGHVSKNCNMESRCVKCGAHHSSQECKKEKTAPAKCANCDEAHPANFRNCAARLRYEETKKKTPRTSVPMPAPRPSPRTNSLSSRILDGRSWSQVAAGRQEIPPAPSTPQVSEIPSSNNMSTDALLKLVLQVHQLKKKLAACPAKEQRILLIIQLADCLEDV